jgi:O-antigen/teichoic acid export membrane protein
MYNLVTQVVLVLISFVSFPILVRRISAEGFGLLSLVWVLVGYFSLLDLGVSRAITKFISELLARNDPRRIHDITWTSLTLSVIFGCIVGVIVLFSRELVLTNLFHVTGSMRDEASTSLLIASLGIPFMLAQGILRGVQTAYQRFDLVNGFQAVTGAMQWVGSVLIVLAGGGVREVVFLTVLSRVLAVGASLALLPHMMPGVFRGMRLWDRTLARTLLSFGGWVSLSQVIGPLFLYVDRLMIASFMALSAVAYYTVPQETVNRMLILPLSLTSALYPILSGWSTGMRGSEYAGAMYTRAVKYVAVLILPLAVLLFVFSREVLMVWMGEEFSGHGAFAMQILLVGLLFNAVAQIPVTALHAYGRPDLPAKFNLVELPVMIGLNLALIPMFGIAGAAITWTLRVILDAVLLFRAARPYVSGAKFFPQTERAAGRTYVYAAGLCLLIGLICSSNNEVIRIVAACVFVTAYIFGVWRHGFDEADRGFLLELRSRFLA